MKIAPRLDRFLAFVIDNFLLTVPGSILIYAGGEASALAVFGMFACSIAYNVVSLASVWQATPGQYFMRLRVIRTDGKSISERDALERFLAFFLPFLPMYLSIAPQEVLSMSSCAMMLAWFLPIFTRPDHRGVHDVLCHTLVVSAPR